MVFSAKVHGTYRWALKGYALHVCRRCDKVFLRRGDITARKFRWCSDLIVFHLIAQTISAPRGGKMMVINWCELTAIFYIKEVLRDSVVPRMREIVRVLDNDIIESLVWKKAFNFLAAVLAVLFLVFGDGSCYFLSDEFIITCELRTYVRANVGR